MATMIKLLILCFIIATATSLRCLPCPTDPVCEPLPESEECVPAFKPCSCCPDCAGRFGAKCSGLSVKCHPDFVCVNEDGEEFSIVPWHYISMKGICIRKRCPKKSTDPNIVGK